MTISLLILGQLLTMLLAWRVVVLHTRNKHFLKVEDGEDAVWAVFLILIPIVNIIIIIIGGILLLSYNKDKWVNLFK